MKVSPAGHSDDPSRFSKARADPYGGRLLPVCCPAHRGSPSGPQSARSPVYPGGPSAAVGSIPESLSNVSSIGCLGGTWHDLDLGRPIAAQLQRCAQLLGVDLATIQEAAANVEPYICADGTRIWSLKLPASNRPRVALKLDSVRTT